jgi:ATP-dependent phosphofructokinase / diphosphate-dependent phosphofructokinase
MKRNALVAQSGGPSPVINASLHGVIEACLDRHGEIGSIYAPRHGIEGVLQEELIDVGAQDRHEIALLRKTPAAGVIGTCRYKLKEEQTEDFQRIIDVFRAHDIGFFFSIGGNDSMDTAAKVAGLAKAEGHDLIAVGVPKTIDNDLGDEARTIIDHTPGYGSCARYWAYLIQNVNGENRGMCVSEPAAANSVRHLPAEWIASDKLDITDALIDYARPLIGDEPPELAIEGGDQCVGLLVLRVGLHGEPRDR